MLSLCICGTAITSQYLAERYKVNTPMLQSFINYCLLFLIYTVMLAFQSGSDNLLYILKKKWWKCILLGLADVEANYLIVRAYQYTTLTSVQVRRSPLTSLDFLTLREESELICTQLICLRTCSLRKKLKTVDAICFPVEHVY